MYKHEVIPRCLPVCHSRGSVFFLFVFFTLYDGLCHRAVTPQLGITALDTYSALPVCKAIYKCMGSSADQQHYSLALCVQSEMDADKASLLIQN